MVLWMDIGTEKYRTYITTVERQKLTQQEKERLEYIESGDYLVNVIQGDWFEYTDNPPRPKKQS